jgi:hypothetical protein
MAHQKLQLDTLLRSIESLIVYTLFMVFYLIMKAQREAKNL